MRVGALPQIDTAAAAARRGVEVAPERTRVSRGEIRDAIARAHTRITGKAPSAGLLDVLTAQACLETGSGASMYNFNFGGIKGIGPSGLTARCRTHEVVGGREMEIRDGFRAYRTLDEGATDYVTTMVTRFGSAVGAASDGDVRAFAHALKQSGYYTAREEDYAAGLLALTGAPASPACGPAAAPAPRELPSVEEWSRMLGGLDVSNAAVIAAPADSDTDGGGRRM